MSARSPDVAADDPATPPVGLGDHWAAYAPALRRFFGRRVSRRDEIDDLVQEAFVRLLAIERAQTLSRPGAYLFKIAANLLADQGRRGRSPLATAQPLDETRLAGAEPSQEIGRHYVDLQQALEAALRELPIRCQQVFVLRRYEQLATPDVARELGISVRMVQKHMVQAMAHLHRRLHPFMAGSRP